MTGNRVRIYLLGAMYVSLLCRCTAEPVVEVELQEARSVEVSIAPPDLGIPVSLTRAGGDAIPEQLPMGATVRIAAYYRKAADGPVDFATKAPTYQATYEVGADGSLSPCGVDDVDGKKISNTGSGLTVRGGTYDFYAVSPARRLQQGSDNKYQITGILHKEDVMTSFQRNVTVLTTSNTVTLNTFTRKCALVVFNVKPSPDNVLPFDRLYGTSLTLKKVSASGASLIAGEGTGIPLTGGGTGTASEVTFADGDFEPVSGTNPTGLNKAKGVILPKTNAAFDVSLTVVRDDETATLSATIDKNITFDPGKRYIFTLEVKNNTSRLQLTVQNWTPILFTDPSVGSPDPNRPTDPDIDTGTGTTITVAEWNEIPWTGNGQVGSTPAILQIDESTLKRYYERMKASSSSDEWTDYPPFDADGVNTAASHGLTDIVLSSTPTMTGSYRVQVQKTQDRRRFSYNPNAKIYCNDLREDGFNDWRLPTMIELFAMYDKCRGNDLNAADGQTGSEKKAAERLGEPFIANNYWPSSMHGGNIDPRARCVLYFNDGNFGGAHPTHAYGCVRCVRDIN